MGQLSVSAARYGCAATCLVSVLLVAGCTGGAAARGRIAFNNSEFYGETGEFKQEAAKQAYFDLLACHGYPISDNLKDNVFVMDFGLGRFAEVGLGGMFWVNDRKAGIGGLELFLLPNQMIPEHWHVPVGDVPPKLETWLVRYGETYAYGEGTPTEPIKVRIPECERPYVTVRHEQILKVGQVAPVIAPGEKHWQMAGPHGAIMTEFSTFHAGEALTFTDPRIK